MAVRVNGKDMKDALNFVPRFIEIIYQSEKRIAAKDSGIIGVGAGKIVET
jgi:hypothetical protein